MNRLLLRSRRLAPVCKDAGDLDLDRTLSTRDLQFPSGQDAGRLARRGRGRTLCGRGGCLLQDEGDRICFGRGGAPLEGPRECCAAHALGRGLLAGPVAVLVDRWQDEPDRVAQILSKAQQCDRPTVGAAFGGQPGQRLDQGGPRSPAALQPPANLAFEDMELLTGARTATWSAASDFRLRTSASSRASE